MSNSRTKNSIINIIVIIVMQILTFSYTLITKNIFLREFSLSIYGVIDLFGTFFRSLMLLELGFGTILIFNLYKPVAINDIDEIKKQLSIFKTIYNCLSAIILFVSIILIPYIYNIFNISYYDKILVYEIYVVNIINILVKYRYLNKISILYAGQYKFIENIIFMMIEFLSFLGRILSILVFKNVYLFLLFHLLAPSLVYFFEVIWIDKKYNLGKIKCVGLKELFESGIITQCKDYIFATIYGLIFSSMDNIIISMKLSTDAVAYTTNYNGILITGTYAVISVMSSLKGVMADYYSTSSDIRSKMDVFLIISSLNFLITSLMSVGFYILMDNFISLWIGETYIISNSIFVSLLIVRIIDCLFEPINMVFVINGYIFKEKLPLILSALTNLVLTVFLLDLYGLIGAYIATFIAQIVYWIGKFYYVLTGIFKSYRSIVLKKYLMYILLIPAQILLVSNITGFLIPNRNTFALFFIKCILVVIITVFIDVFVILIDKPTRNYVKNNILMKVR